MALGSLPRDKAGASEWRERTGQSGLDINWARLVGLGGWNCSGSVTARPGERNAGRSGGIVPLSKCRSSRVNLVIRGNLG